jgi:hypothetical protein
MTERLKQWQQRVISPWSFSMSSNGRLNTWNFNIQIWPNVSGLCSSRFPKSPTTFSEIGGLPVDFPLFTHPVRTNLLITSLDWTTEAVS